MPLHSKVGLCIACRIAVLEHSRSKSRTESVSMGTKGLDTRYPVIDGESGVLLNALSVRLL